MLFKSLFIGEVKLTMPKFSLLLLSCIFSLSAYGQIAVLSRHRAGINITAGAVQNSSKSDLMLLDDKNSYMYGVGAVYEFQINDLLAIRIEPTIEITQASFTDNPNDDVDLYCYTGRPFSVKESPMNYKEIQEYLVEYPATLPGFQQTISRKYTFGYVNIPIHASFRTELKNFRRFYALTGIQTGIRLRCTARDEVGQTASGSEYTSILVRDANRFRFNLSLGGGIEKLLQGTSSFFVEVLLDVGLSNVFSQNTNHGTIYTNHDLTGYYSAENLTGSDDLKQSHLLQNSVKLRLGLLF